MFSIVMLCFFVASSIFAMDVDDGTDKKINISATYNPLPNRHITNGELNYRNGNWQEALHHYENALPTVYDELDRLDLAQHLYLQSGMKLTDLGKIAHANNMVGMQFRAQKCYRSLIQNVNHPDLKEFPMWLEQAGLFFLYFEEADKEKREENLNLAISALNHVATKSCSYMDQYSFANLAYAFLQKQNFFHAALYYQCAMFCDIIEQNCAALGKRKSPLNMSIRNNCAYALNMAQTSRDFICKQALTMAMKTSAVQQHLSENPELLTEIETMLVERFQ